MTSQRKAINLNSIFKGVDNKSPDNKQSQTTKSSSNPLSMKNFAAFEEPQEKPKEEKKATNSIALGLSKLFDKADAMQKKEKDDSIIDKHK